jgi:hypothetical protein
MLGPADRARAHILPPGDFDTRWQGKRGQVNLVFDIGSLDNPNILGSMRTVLNAFDFSYQLRAAAGATPPVLAVAVPYGGPTALNLDDAMWAKYRLGHRYGVKDPQTGAWAARNVYWYRQSQDDGSLPPSDPKSLWMDASIDAFQRRGVVFAC